MPLAATAGWTLNSAVLSLVTVNESVWPASSAGPADRPVAQFVTVWAPASSSTAWFDPLVNEGASLTCVTVIVTCAVSLPPLPSEIV